MTATDDRDAMLARLCDVPEDWDGWRVLADCCEERGLDDEGACYRWMADERKRPHTIDHLRNGCTVFEFVWYDGQRAGCSGNDPESDLPRRLFGALAQSIRPHERDREYYTMQDAVTALVRAWVEVGGYREGG